MHERLGLLFEHEIFEQPLVWERVARGDAAARVARALVGPVVLLGSGSSYFAALLGALALRRRGVDAYAVAATEVRHDHIAYRHRIVVAVSQSGRSTDVLGAIELLEPSTLVAITNTPESPLGRMANVCVDLSAGRERAIPASKSVSTTIAVLLWAASLVAGDGRCDAAMLCDAAAAVRAFLARPPQSIATIADRIARRRNVVVLGSDYGLPLALETALKLKEAAYMPAEGFAAGEFRHGSIAVVDASYAIIGIVDRESEAAVAPAMIDLATSDALRLTIGASIAREIPHLGPEMAPPFNVLGWIVTAQLLALHVARARHVESDTPRRLTKAVVDRS